MDPNASCSRPGSARPPPPLPSSAARIPSAAAAPRFPPGARCRADVLGGAAGNLRQSWDGPARFWPGPAGRAFRSGTSRTPRCWGTSSAASTCSASSTRSVTSATSAAVRRPSCCSPARCEWVGGGQCPARCRPALHLCARGALAAEMRRDGFLPAVPQSYESLLSSTSARQPLSGGWNLNALPGTLCWKRSDVRNGARDLSAGDQHGTDTLPDFGRSSLGRAGGTLAWL
jgi:hypothetical protein